MAKDRDGQRNQDEFSLEAILAEFGSGSGERQGEPPAAPSDARTEESATGRDGPPDAPQRDELAEQDWFPTRPRTPRPEDGEDHPTTPFPIVGRREREEKVTPFPKAAPKIIREAAPPPLPPEPEPEPEPPQEEKVLEFPSPEPDNPVAAGIDHLRRKADQFADHMFEEEGAEAAKAVRRAERLIPGVDEEAPASPVRERKPRKRLPPAPDLPPAELAKRYSKGLNGLRLRCFLVFLLIPATVYLTAAPDLLWPLPEQLAGNAGLQCYALAGLQVLAMLLGIDEVLGGLIRSFQHRVGMERLSCRTAASASEPYLVTRDEGKWNNRDTYAKWSGPLNGFGSQIQSSDGARRIYRIMVPLLLLAGVLVALISSVGHQRPEDFLWCLASILTAAGSLSATLCFGLPWRKISARLSKSGAALAGWQGVTNTTGSSNLLLTDIDLFPIGSVSLNGVKIFGDFPIEKVVAVTATVIRDSGSGLDKVFHDLLRSQGAVYRRGEDLTAFEGGGLSEIIRNQQVLVGSAAFMVLMDIALPPGLKVKNAVFCAIDGELAGIFALNYHLPGSVTPAIDSLIQNRVTPVLATRDFNLIPSMLRQRFKLPAEKLEFPPVHRRRELSEPEQEHSETLAAVLCREGLGPYAEAVVGGRRLRTAVRQSAVLSCLGSVIGVLLAFYLTYVAAYNSLTPLNLTLFLFMWLVPTPLIAGWVDRY